jgi:hypothetical protein
MLSFEGYDGVRAIDWANRHRDVWWQWWRYAGDSRNLVLRASRSTQDLGYLVLRRPRYLRFARSITGAEFMGGPDAVKTMRFPPPPGLDLSGTQVIVLRNQSQEFCAACKGLTFYRRTDVGEP